MEFVSAGLATACDADADAVSDLEGTREPGGVVEEHPTTNAITSADASDLLDHLLPTAKMLWP